MVDKSKVPSAGINQIRCCGSSDYAPLSLWYRLPVQLFWEYIPRGIGCQDKNQVLRETWFLSYSALPLFLELQFLRTGTRVEGKEIYQKTVELLGLVHHGEMA